MQIKRVIRYGRGMVATMIWRARGVSIADRIVVEGYTPSIAPDGRLKLGSRVSFRGMRARSRLGVWGNAELEIGDRSFINSGVTIESTLSIRIGRNCLIGDRVTIQDSNYHEVDENSGVRRRPIKIGNNVWIGNGSIILPGVEIGDHSVVGAGSVVTKAVPPFSVVAGNPARFIRHVQASEGFTRT